MRALLSIRGFILFFTGEMTLAVSWEELKQTKIDLTTVRNITKVVFDTIFSEQFEVQPLCFGGENLYKYQSLVLPFQGAFIIKDRHLRLKTRN